MTWILTTLCALGIGLAAGCLIRRRMSSGGDRSMDDALSRIDRLLNTFEIDGDCSYYLNRLVVETALRNSGAQTIMLLEDSEKSRRNYGLPPGLTARVNVLLAMARDGDRMTEIEDWRNTILEWEWPERSRKSTSKTSAGAVWIDEHRTLTSADDSRCLPSQGGLWLLPINSAKSHPKWLALSGPRHRLEKQLPQLEHVAEGYLIDDGAFRKGFAMLKVGKQAFESSNLPLALVVADHIIQINQMFEELTGYDRNVLIGKAFQFVLFPDDAPDVQQQFLNVLKNGQNPEEFEARIVRQDGTQITVGIYPIPVNNFDERALVVSARDITPQIHLEQTLLSRIAQQELVIEELADAKHSLELQADEVQSSAESCQERLKLTENILSSITDWIRVVDKDYIVSYQNPGMREAMGDMVGRKCYQSLGASSACNGCPLNDTANIDSNRQVEFAMGSNSYSALCSPVKNLDGSIHAIVELIQNISELKLLQEAMREKSEILEAVNDSVVELNRNLEYATQQLAEKNSELEQLNLELKTLDQLKDNFVTTVSHELRAPLTSIKGSVSVILNGMVGTVDDKISQYLTVCLRNTDRLIQLINDLLDLSKIESGRIKINPQECQLRAIAQEVVEDLTNYALDRDVKLRVEVPDNLTIWADRDRCIQVLQNLLSNALKFTDSGEVAIRGLKSEGSTRIEVEDTGIGIPDDQKERIFGKFNQVDSSLTRKVGGTGLGLAICRAIVEEHGGSISVESQLGKGSCFRIILPNGPTDAPENLVGADHASASCPKVLCETESKTISEGEKHG